MPPAELVDTVLLAAYVWMDRYYAKQLRAQRLARLRVLQQQLMISGDAGAGRPSHQRSSTGVNSLPRNSKVTKALLREEVSALDTARQTRGRRSDRATGRVLDNEGAQCWMKESGVWRWVLTLGAVCWPARNSLLQSWRRRGSKVATPAREAWNRQLSVVLRTVIMFLCVHRLTTRIASLMMAVSSTIGEF